MSPPDLVVLIDMDPPSEEGGGSRGFYPARPGGPPPEARMQARFAAAFEFVRTACAGHATLTVHTSPRFRLDLLRPPYAALWRQAVSLGCDLALHPHEDLADGGNLYADTNHMATVIRDVRTIAAATDIPFAGFRSGTFAFSPTIPGLLADAGLMLDLSACPGGHDAARNVSWPRDAAARLLEHGVLEVPIGWNGRGTDLGRDYLFNERMDIAGLRGVWDDLCAATCPPGTVNFLCHGFGLVETRWRDQAEAFLAYVAGTGAAVLPARHVRDRHLQGVNG